MVMAAKGSAFKKSYNKILEIYHMLPMIANLRPALPPAIRAIRTCGLAVHWIILRIFLFLSYQILISAKKGYTLRKNQSASKAGGINNFHERNTNAERKGKA
jgi:hypothetical protein